MRWGINPPTVILVLDTRIHTIAHITDYLNNHSESFVGCAARTNHSNFVGWVDHQKIVGWVNKGNPTPIPNKTNGSRDTCRSHKTHNLSTVILVLDTRISTLR